MFVCTYEYVSVNTSVKCVTIQTLFFQVTPTNVSNVTDNAAMSVDKPRDRQAQQPAERRQRDDFKALSLPRRLPASLCARLPLIFHTLNEVFRFSFLFLFATKCQSGVTGFGN